MSDVVISFRDGTERWLSPPQSVVFGRATSDNIVGLDASDKGISSRAGAVTWTRSGWQVVNLSTKRPLFVEVPGNARFRLDCAQRFAICDRSVDVVVEGRIRRHAITVTSPSLPAAGGVLAERDEPVDRASEEETDLVELDVSRTDFLVLVAMVSPRLARFPHRGEHPLTYEAIARLLGPGFSATGVRRRIDRVREALAAGHVFIEGPQARYELTDHLLEHRIVRPSHLALLDRHQEGG